MAKSRPHTMGLTTTGRSRYTRTPQQQQRGARKVCVLHDRESRYTRTPQQRGVRKVCVWYGHSGLVYTKKKEILGRYCASVYPDGGAWVTPTRHPHKAT